MITTVTLNAAIDKTYYLPHYEANEVNRVESVYAEPGGKGLNVAKVLSQLGTPVLATGLVAGFNGKQICSLLDAIGIKHRFVEAEGESRLCLNIIAEESGEQTEILEPGPAISLSAWKKTEKVIAELAMESDCMVFSGSLPRGLDATSYQNLISIAKENGTKTILDTSGMALSEGIKAKPYMIKPNKKEFEMLSREKFSSTADLIEGLKQVEFDIPLMVVTLGSEGAAAKVDGEVYWVICPEISAINPVGSGDAFTAGAAYGLVNQLDLEEVLKIASAAGAANALEKRAGMITLSNFQKIKDEIKIL